MYTISQTFQFITHAGKTTQYEVLASGKPSFNRKSMINILSWTKVLGDITKKRRFYFKITKSLLLQVAHDLKCLIWEDHTSMGNTDHARTLYPRASAKKKVLSLLPFLSWHHTLNFWDLLILFFHAWTTQREEILHPFLLLVKKKYRFVSSAKIPRTLQFHLWFSLPQIFFSHRIPELSNVLLVSNYMKASSSRHQCSCLGRSGDLGVLSWPCPLATVDGFRSEPLMQGVFITNLPQD